jgi:hypothetical protein
MAMMRQGAFGPTAIVTGSDVFFGMMRMLQMLSELEGGPAIGVFRDIAEAREGLRTR